MGEEAPCWLPQELASVELGGQGRWIHVCRKAASTDGGKEWQRGRHTSLLGGPNRAIHIVASVINT